MSKKIQVTVLGAGNMGTAIADVIGNNGFVVKLWNYEGDLEPLEQIAAHHENKKYLAGVKLSHNIIPEKDLALAVKNSSIIFFVLPSGFIGDLTKRVAPFISKKTVCVDTSKGFDEKTLAIVPVLMKKYLPMHSRKLVVSISGPAIAVDMAKGAFTAMNVAGEKQEAVNLTKKVLMNQNLRLKQNNDLIGTEVAGSLKNVYAIAIGISDCYGWPMNTKAAILVCALKEISGLIKKMGGKEETVFDLAGLGDLVATAMSTHSRNRRFGECLPKHTSKDSAAKEVGQVVEGIKTCQLALALAKKYKIKMPLAEAIYNIVWKNAPADITLKKYLKTIS